MNLGLVRDLGEAVVGKFAEKANEAVNDANRLLILLQEAGYQIGEFEVELKASPRVTITLKADTMVSDSKLDALAQANKESEMVVLVLSALGQANKFRGKVSLNTIELRGAKIVLEATPSVSLQWKEKAAANAAGAS